MKQLRRLLPFLSWPAPSVALIKGEALAGLTVGLMVIPQGVAYAALAGMPLETGLYASMLPALVAVLFSSSVRLSVGPTALSCLLVSASLTGLALPGSPDWVNLAIWLSILAGLIQIVLGWVHFGWLLNVVNAPVLMGFTQAAAVLIILSQWQSLVGWVGLSGGINLETLAYGAFGLGLLILSRRLKPSFPAVLLLVVCSAAISRYTGYVDRGGVVVGALPSGISFLALPQALRWSQLQSLVMPVLVITLVSFLETASSAKVDNSRQGRGWNQNQDLIGQGLAKIASGLAGAFPTSSSFSRSALNLYAGAQTGWATVFSVAVVWLASLYFLPVLHHVPQAVLAAIVVVAVLGLIRPSKFVRLWLVARVEAGIAGVTVVATLLSAPSMYWGVMTGVLMSLAHFLYRRLHPRIVEVGVHSDGRLRDRHLWSLPPLACATLALRMDAALDFGSASALEQRIVDQLAADPTVRHVVLFAQSMNHIDATGVEALERILQQLSVQGRILVLVGVKLPVERALKAAGFWEQTEALHTFVHDEDAFAYLRADACEN
ncbi:SulP family inorganic anion transporter [Betaproteobacteria bacterium LSUCC0117]|nr:SulP family inorganic anion transporter [Betaproteobacteria bacterium LSUCC0117]